MAKNVDLDDMILEIISDLRKDRGHALNFLQDLEASLGTKNEHVTLGPIAVQYLGKAQKSADQMIKLIEILKKYAEEEDDFGDFSGILSENSDESDGGLTSKKKDFDFSSENVKSLLDEEEIEEEEE